FSNSVELYDKVIGHYLNLKHSQYVGVTTRRVFNIGEELNNIESWIYLRVTFSILVIKVLFPN
ncbi:IS1 family transposase, partial [Escherichia coli]|uniref:hypothetical protein n=1 Tax=Escherichia coli TaxID=562 RepID=UPI002927A8DC